MFLLFAPSTFSHKYKTDSLLDFNQFCYAFAVF